MTSYFLNIVLSIFVLDRRYAHFSIFSVLTTFLWILYSQPVLDLKTYTMYFAEDYGFEFGYEIFSYLIYLVTTNKVVGMKLSQCLAFILGVSLLFIFTRQKQGMRQFSIVLVLFVNSIFFKMGNFNVFRQYIACIIAIGAIGSFRQWKVISWIYLASLFHKTSILFVVNKIYDKLPGKKLKLFITLIFVILTVGSIEILISASKYAFYIEIGQFDGRASAISRLIPVLIFSCSCFYLQRRIKVNFGYDSLFISIFNFQIVLLFLIVALSFNPIFNEIQSRFIFFYYFVSLVLYSRAMCVMFSAQFFIWFIVFNSVYPPAVSISTGNML